MKYRALIDAGVGLYYASAILIDGMNKKPINKQYKHRKNTEFCI